MAAAVCVVGIALGPALLGYAPLGGDPELMYQPIKAELSRALASGRLPFWSDRFGLGVPLVAESHVAAFHPPNWVSYRPYRRDDGGTILGSGDHLGSTIRFGLLNARLHACKPLSSV